TRVIDRLEFDQLYGSVTFTAKTTAVVTDVDVTIQYPTMAGLRETKIGYWEWQPGSIGYDTTTDAPPLPGGVLGPREEFSVMSIRPHPYNLYSKKRLEVLRRFGETIEQAATVWNAKFPDRVNWYSSSASPQS